MLEKPIELLMLKNVVRYNFLGIFPVRKSVCVEMYRSHEREVSCKPIFVKKNTQ